MVQGIPPRGKHNFNQNTNLLKSNSSYFQYSWRPPDHSLGTYNQLSRFHCGFIYKPQSRWKGDWYGLPDVQTCQITRYMNLLFWFPRRRLSGLNMGMSNLYIQRWYCIHQSLIFGVRLQAVWLLCKSYLRWEILWYLISNFTEFRYFYK